MLRVLGRLRDDVSVDRARAELDTLASALAGEYPETNRATGATVTTLLEQLTRDARPSLYALAAAVVALLLVACANASGLLIGQSLERRHEFATRLALGASRSRIVRQIVSENALVGLLAAAGGFALATWAGDLLVAAAAASGIPRASDIRVGWTAFAVGAVLSLICTTACALFAAYETTRSRDLDIVRSTRGATPRRTRARAILIGVEAALSLALLAGGALLIRSFYALQATNPGFDVAHVITTRVSVPGARYPAGPVLANVYDRIVERVSTLPGVESASVVDWLPVGGFGASVSLRVPGSSPTTGHALAELRVVGLDYFRTIGVPIVAGRPFDRRDVEGAPAVVAMNQSFARTYFGTQNPVGRHLILERGGSPRDVEVVAVVGDIRELALRISPGPGIYGPKTQQPWIQHETRDLVVRSNTDVGALAPAIASVLREIDPDIPRAPVQQMTEVIGGALARPRFYAATVAAFALIAVLLAVFGIFGAVTSAIAVRRRELGVRLALGASPAHVLRSAASYGATPTLVGLAAGVPLSIAAGKLVEQQLYGVGPADLQTLGVAVSVMAFVTVTAAFVPAVRAMRIDAVSVLKHETG
jgi:putative ABC transport system permease protein